MRYYPKGAHYFRVKNGEVGPRQKCTHATNIVGIMGGAGGSAIVRPRGKLNWYRFDAEQRSIYARLIEIGDDPDVLIMKALLGG